MTYSIVARHKATGAFGVAIASYAPFAGAVCPAALAGVGALTTQAIPDVEHKPRGLALLAEGVSAEAVVARLAADDPHIASRQFAVVDREGVAAAHTGSACLADAGQLIGDGYAVQANLMRSPGVWPAMAEAWEAHREDEFVAALLAALDAGEAAGGDVRGRQSAAVLVVPASGTSAARTVDLRVDSAVEPLLDLRRLAGIRRAWATAETADAAAPEERAALMEEALRLAPGWLELQLFTGFAAMEVGDEDRAAALVREVVASDPSWLQFLRRFPVEDVPGAARTLALLSDDA